MLSLQGNLTDVPVPAEKEEHDKNGKGREDESAEAKDLSTHSIFFIVHYRLICCRAIPLMYLVPAKKEEHDKDSKAEEEDNAKPDVPTRVDEAVRDAKVALLKVRDSKGTHTALPTAC